MVDSFTKESFPILDMTTVVFRNGLNTRKSDNELRCILLLLFISSMSFELEFVLLVINFFVSINRYLLPSLKYS